MNINEEDIFLRPFQDDDVKDFEKWLDKEYIKKWFNKESWLEQINGRNNEFSYISHYIVYCGNKKIGFCHYLDGYYAQDIYENIIEKNYSYELNYLIGEEKYLDIGIGKIIIKKMEKIIKEIGGKELLADPEPENIISQKLLLSNGFIKIKDGDFRKKI